MLPSALDAVRVYTRRGLGDHSLAILVIDILQVECVNMAGQIAEFVSSAVFTTVKRNNGSLGETDPNIVKRILMRKSTLQPEMRKTPSGGTESP
jgi:hypothetical protein